MVAGAADPAALHGEGRLPGSAELPKATPPAAGDAALPKVGVPNFGPPKAGVAGVPKEDAPKAAPVVATGPEDAFGQPEGLLG